MTWRREGGVVVFGPECAAAILDQERVMIASGIEKAEAGALQGVSGLTADQLRKDFPEAVRDAQEFLLREISQEQGEQRTIHESVMSPFKRV